MADKYSFTTGDIAVDVLFGLYESPGNSAEAIGAMGNTFASGANLTLGSVAVTGSFFRG